MSIFPRESQEEEDTEAEYLSTSPIAMSDYQRVVLREDTQAEFKTANPALVRGELAVAFAGEAEGSKPVSMKVGTGEAYNQTPELGGNYPQPLKNGVFIYDYEPGAYGEGRIVVINNEKLYYLKAAVARPFTSADFAAELAAGQWASLGSEFTGSGDEADYFVHVRRTIGEAGYYLATGWNSMYFDEVVADLGQCWDGSDPTNQAFIVPVEGVYVVTTRLQMPALPEPSWQEGLRYAQGPATANTSQPQLNYFNTSASNYNHTVNSHTAYYTAGQRICMTYWLDGFVAPAYAEMSVRYLPPQVVSAVGGEGDGGEGDFLPLSGNSPENFMTGPIVLGGYDEDAGEVFQGNMDLYDTAQGAYLSVFAEDGWQMYMNYQRFVCLSPYEPNQFAQPLTYTGSQSNQWQSLEDDDNTYLTKRNFVDLNVWNTGEGFRSGSLGTNNNVYGGSSAAIGANNYVLDDRSLAVGTQNQAQGYNSVAFGAYSTTRNFCAFASGYHTEAAADYSQAEGFNSIANGEASHAEGRYSVTNGDYAHAEGHQTVAGAEASHAEGYFTAAGGYASHAEGYETISSGDYSHAEGIATEAFGEAGHVEGYYSRTFDVAGHAEGKLTHCEGVAAHTEGLSTRTSATAAHAEGVQTIAAGYASHAEGAFSQTLPSAEAAHAHGVAGIARHIGEEVLGGGYLTFITELNDPYSSPYQFLSFQKSRIILSYDSRQDAVVASRALDNYNNGLASADEISIVENGLNNHYASRYGIPGNTNNAWVRPLGFAGTDRYGLADGVPLTPEPGIVIPLGIQAVFHIKGMISSSSGALYLFDNRVIINSGDGISVSMVESRDVAVLDGNYRIKPYYDPNNNYSAASNYQYLRLLISNTGNNNGDHLLRLAGTMASRTASLEVSWMMLPITRV